MDSRPAAGRAGWSAGAAFLAAATLAGACGDDMDTPPRGFAVAGTAAGVLGPVALELRLGNDIELLAVTGEGPFAFETWLQDGDSYTVVFTDPDVPCELRNETGVIAGADTAIELTCTVPSLSSVVVSGMAPELALAPGTSDYVVDLPLAQPSAMVTATVATAGDTLTLAGAPLENGAPSHEIALELGDNVVDIMVENSRGWQRPYRLTLRRAAQLAQYAYGKASNTGAEDNFGLSVALSGDTLAVGAPGEDSLATGVVGDQASDEAPDSGAVYVFRRSGAVWRQEAYLKASNTGAEDNFGLSVALSGDTLVVGAPREESAATGVDGEQDNDFLDGSGAVYVFRRTDGAWQQEAYVKASNTGRYDRFGWSVALYEDTLVVGAPFEGSAATGVDGDQTDDSAGGSGAVYVFRRTDGAWQQEVYVKASNTGTSDDFGDSVALWGETFAVGAPFEDSAATGVDGDQTDDSAGGSGAVYVFRRTDGAWQQEAYVKASNTDASDRFGYGIALHGDTLAVGAYREGSAARGVDGDQGNDDGFPSSGAVYAFRRTGAAWQQEAYLKASNTGDRDNFGLAVALSDDLLVVGAPGEDSPATGVDGDQTVHGAEDSGAVYVFRRGEGTWQQAAYLKASNTGASDSFGDALACSADTVAAGAWGEASTATGVDGDQTDDSALASGAVYIFH